MNNKQELGELCSKCGGKCCRCHTQILLSDMDDIDKLDELGANIEDDRTFGLTILCPSGICGFLKKGKCSIYKDRPMACREFDCRDPRRQDSVVFEDFPEHAEVVKQCS